METDWVRFSIFLSVRPLEEKHFEVSQTQKSRYFRLKSAGLSPHFSVFHFRT